MIKLARTLRRVSIVMLVITVAMTFLGGAGTTCAAFSPEKFDSMVPLIPYRWLYQALVVATLGAAILGAWATSTFVRGRRNSVSWVIGFLILGLALAGIQMLASHRLRGATAPTNMRFLLTALTLGSILVLRLPGIRDRSAGDGAAGRRHSDAAPTGLALVLSGVLTWTTWLWAGPSHQTDGTNWVLDLQMPLLIGGSVLVVWGSVLFARGRRGRLVTGRSRARLAQSVHHRVP